MTLTTAPVLRLTSEVPRVEVNLLTLRATRDGRDLHLHPMETRLLVRLMASAPLPLGDFTLLRDVFGLTHRPETNTLAVHVSRLRSKLGQPHLVWSSRGWADRSATYAFVWPCTLTIQGLTLTRETR